MRNKSVDALGRNMGTHTLESRGTGAAEAFSITGAGATSLAGLGLTGIWSQALAASRATPTGLTHTAEPGGGGSEVWQVGGDSRRGSWERALPAWCVMADSMTTGLVGTGMVRR